jgi:hypothetical protein
MKKDIKSRAKNYRIWLLATFSEVKEKECYWDPADTFRLTHNDLKDFLIEYYIFEFFFWIEGPSALAEVVQDCLIEEIKDLPEGLSPTGERGIPFCPLLFRIIRKQPNDKAFTQYLAVEIE